MNVSHHTFAAGQNYAAQNEPSADYELLHSLRQSALSDFANGHSKEWNRGLAEGYRLRMRAMVNAGLDMEEKQNAEDDAENNRRLNSLGVAA